MYKLTIFKNIYDNKTHRRMSFESWDTFVAFLYKLSEIPIKNKKDANLISMATYKPNTTRANANVEEWAHWVALDVDDVELKEDEVRDYISDRLSGWNYVVYSTASCRPDKAKFRVIVQLERPVEASEIKHFWFAINSELESIGDKQTKDFSRMFYVPATYDNASNFIFHVSDRAPLDVDSLLAKHPYKEREGKSFLDRLPPELQQAVVAHRKEMCDNKNFIWSDYKDCPFWPKRLGLEYVTISETGWYHKMYQIMVAIAGNAIQRGYPITAREIATLCKQFDTDNGNWYENRPLEVEADRAVEYAYRNN